MIQLSHLVSSCPSRNDGLFCDTNLQQSEGVVPCESARNPWKTLHNNSSKAVLVLSSLKTYHNIILSPLLLLRCVLQTVSDMVSRPISCQLMTYRLVAWTNPFPFCSSTDQTLEMSTGSDRHCGAERICVVRLSQQFVSINKSRCSPLQTSMNLWYEGH